VELVSIDATMSCLSHAYLSLTSVVGVAQDVTDDRRHAEELRSMQYLQASQEAKVETERNMTGTTGPSYIQRHLGSFINAHRSFFDLSPFFYLSLLRS
jgi:hypothetical protein